MYLGCKGIKWFHPFSKAPVWALEKISDEELNWDELQERKHWG